MTPGVRARSSSSFRPSLWFQAHVPLQLRPSAALPPDRVFLIGRIEHGVRAVGVFIVVVAVYLAVLSLPPFDSVRKHFFLLVFRVSHVQANPVADTYVPNKLTGSLSNIGQKISLIFFGPAY